MKLFLTLCLIGLSSFTTYEAPKANPPRPWAKAAKEHLPPAEPGKDYTPVVVPNGNKMSYKVIDGVKVFHLNVEEITWEVAEGLVIDTWGYNGSVPGPVIELGEGDRVRIYVTNKLQAPTTVHWHGILIPCGMDGVGGVTQPAIPPGDTCIYEFIVPTSGTFMYHSHFDSLTQEGMGLVGMLIVHKREKDPSKRPDRDFVLLLHEWDIPIGTSKPNVDSKTGFNVFTMNGKVMPYTEPLVAKLGEKVWIRYGNLSAMDHHPIHLHGYAFKVIGSSGGWAKDPDALLPETTVLVPVGGAKVIEFIANNPGDWLFHCHMTRHTTNQLSKGVLSKIGMDVKGLNEKIQKLIPGYVTMDTEELKDLTKKERPLPDNSIPLLGLDERFGSTVLGGMANVLKVREGITSYKDPGPYEFPEGTMARIATPEELKKDEIALED